MSYVIFKLNNNQGERAFNNSNQQITLPLHADIIQCRKDLDGTSHIYKVFDDNHTTYLKLTSHPNILAEGTSLGSVITSNRQRRRRRRANHRALDSIEITPSGREMRISLPLPLPLPDDIELLPDNAKNAIHCYVLALAFLAKSEHFRQRTIEAPRNENIQEISKIHTEINEFTIKYCYSKRLNPVVGGDKETEKIWDMIARGTKLQDTLDGSREHIFSTINLVKSEHRERKEIDFRTLTLIPIAIGASAFLFDFSSKLILNPRLSYDTTFAATTFLALMLPAWVTCIAFTKNWKKRHFWFYLLLLSLIFLIPAAASLFPSTKPITTENQALPARTSFYNCGPQAQHFECLHTTTIPYSTANNCCGWRVDYSITRDGGDATETGGFYPKHTHPHQHQ